MYGDTWQVRWKEFLSDSYVYGSKIEFNEDGSVSYKNRLMPPGTVIHTWYSMTNFQGNRIEPSLPLIDGERAYSIAVNIDYHNSESEALMLRIIFFDRYRQDDRHRSGNPRKLWTGARRNSGACGPFQRGRHR